MLRVTLVGNDPDGAGGVASVCRNTLAWSTSDLQITMLPSYWHGDRVRSLGLTLRAAVALMTARRAEVGVVHAHLTLRGSFLREGGLLWLARLRGFPTCATIHGSSFVDFQRKHARLVRWVLRAASVVLVLTDGAGRALAGSHQHVVRTTNAVPVRPSSGRQRKDFLFAGEVGARKGVDVLLEAWAEGLGTDDRLLIAGQVAADYAVPSHDASVELLGPLDPSEVAALLDSVKAAVLPSRAEALPVFVLESLAAGTPVISTDVGALRSAVDGCGLLVPVEDCSALREALLRAATDDSGMRLLGQAAHARSVERYSEDALRRQLVDVWTGCGRRA